MCCFRVLDLKSRDGRVRLKRRDVTADLGTRRSKGRHRRHADGDGLLKAFLKNRMAYQYYKRILI